MFTPLTLSIFRGVLSPDRLAEQRISDRQLSQAARQLAYLPAEGEALHRQFNEWLSAWQIQLPDMAAFSWADTCIAQTSPHIPWITFLRQSEMEYIASVTYAEVPASPLAAFYAAVLAAESRWLRVSLKRILSGLYDEFQAHDLLCSVLDEIYFTGALVGDVSSGVAADWLRLMLKGAMASLYLELTADFSYLLEADDYLDYSTLLSTSPYALASPVEPVMQQALWLHNTRLKINKVRRYYMVHAHEYRHKQTLSEVRSLYAGLLFLWEKLNATPEACTSLLSAIRLLENWLYLASLPPGGQQLPPYASMSDPLWSCRSMQQLYDQHYSGHYLTSEGRAAVHCLDSYLQEEGLLFLGDSDVPTGSIPRLLKQRLQKQYSYYTQNYAASYRPLQPDKELVPVPAPLPAAAPDERQVHQLLHFLCERHDSQGNLLMQPNEVDRLEHLFLDFLRGKMPQESPRKFTIPKDFNSIFYGLFFHYHQQCGGNKELYACFLVIVFAVDATTDMLISNYSRSIKAYVKYASEAA